VRDALLIFSFYLPTNDARLTAVDHAAVDHANQKISKTSA